jgi:glutamate synthase domain-containing protein 2
MDTLQLLASQIIQWSALTLLFIVGLGIIYIAVIYVIDKTQTEQTIRRNYPVVGRFRYIFEHAGEFFRQYFFAMDRKELPFNRADRSWVYRAAKKVDTTIAFGSTRPLNIQGDPIFINCPFPTLDKDIMPSQDITIGEGFADMPYTTNSIINISGMSFGAISKPAVRALSKGAKAAGI